MNGYQLISSFIPYLYLSETFSLHSIPPIKNKMAPAF